MNYMALIYTGEAMAAWEQLSEQEQTAVTGEYMAIAQAPSVSSGAQLQPASTATTVRVQDGRTLTTDGPFSETKEALGGYYLFEADESRRGDRAGGADSRCAVGWRSRGASGGGTLIEQAFREHWGRVLAALIGYLGDFDLAEDAAQEAFALAAERWPREGVPANPVGWLVSTARNRAIDRIRRQRTLAAKSRLLADAQAGEAAEGGGGDHATDLS